MSSDAIYITELTQLIPFGKYRGVPFHKVAQNDQSYIEWMLDNTAVTLDDEITDWFTKLQRGGF